MPHRKSPHQYPCLSCGKLVGLPRAAYLFSISKGRNYGPFHPDCAAKLTEDDEDRIDAWLAAGNDAPIHRDVPESRLSTYAYPYYVNGKWGVPHPSDD